MPLTRDFKGTAEARIVRDPKYRKELLLDGVRYLLAGDLDSGPGPVSAGPHVSTTRR
jgi:hypothetical protein